MQELFLLVCVLLFLPTPSFAMNGDFCIPDGSEKGYRRVGWRCGDKCVPRHYVCDGFVDCEGGEDEENKVRELSKNNFDNVEFVGL